MLYGEKASASLTDEQEIDSKRSGLAISKAVCEIRKGGSCCGAEKWLDKFAEFTEQIYSVVFLQGIKGEANA